MSNQIFNSNIINDLESQNQPLVIMWNAGIKIWPNIVYFDYTPQYVEDLVITLELTNGTQSDVRTFPISIVNYPVENYAPVVQLQLPTRSANVGEQAECIETFIDPDCYIFSLARFEGRAPSTTHLPMLPGNKIRNDQENLTYHATLNGFPSYQFGPWMETIVDTESGLTSLIPKFEVRFELFVTCTDNRGAISWGRRTLIIINPRSWFNHPPIPRGSPTRPIVVKAGEEIILTAPDFNVIDPDGDELFVSCNIGSCGRLSDGAFLWCFQTNFSGVYNVELIFYDIRGGYMIRSIPLIVKPWGSY